MDSGTKYMVDKRLVWTSLACAFTGILLIWLFVQSTEPKFAKVSRYSLAENYGRNVMFEGNVLSVQAGLVIIGTGSESDSTQVLLQQNGNTKPFGINAGVLACASGRVSSVGGNVGLVDASIVPGECVPEPAP